MKVKLNNNNPTKQRIAITAFITLMTYAGYTVSSKTTKSVPLSYLSFKTAAQGNLDIYSNAYSKLTSAKERLFSYNSSANHCINITRQVVKYESG